MADLESGDIDHRIEFNGRKNVSELDEQAMTERRDILAELASRIWNF
jgi:hypothetical protein